MARSSTFTSSIGASMPAKCRAMRTCSTAGLWFGHPPKYKTSIFTATLSYARFQLLKDRALGVAGVHERRVALLLGLLQVGFDLLQLGDLLLHLIDLRRDQVSNVGAAV